MTQQNIDFGSGAENDGEFIATAFQKIQANFNELYLRSIPAGGLTGQVLVKSSAADYAATWASALNGISIGATTPATGAFTTLAASSDSYINSIRVGRGNGNDANSTGLGLGIMGAITSGVENTAVGSGALASTTTGSANVAIGFNALQSNTTGGDNTAIGRFALQANTTGAKNFAMGRGALAANVSSDGSLAIGFQALNANTAANNLAIGYRALAATTSGTPNLGIGYQALTANVSGARNTAVGYASADASTGDDNTALGDNALGAVTSGSQNTGIGSGAGNTTTTGTNVTCIGYGAVASSASASNEFTAGNTSVATARVQVSWTVLSDGRDKELLSTLDGEKCRDLINAIEPVAFEWRTRNGSGLDGQRQAGFIAQQILAAETDTGMRDVLNLVNTSNPDRLEWTPDKLMPVLVRAVQVLSAEVSALRM